MLQFNFQYQADLYKCVPKSIEKSFDKKAMQSLNSAF